MKARKFHCFPPGMLEIPVLSEKQIKRFWNKVAIARNNQCWPWTGFKDKRGYGKLSLSGKTFTATRVSYAIKHGSCPVDKIVCHRCDNTSCVNPKHLWLGTLVDNTQDMLNKHRNSHLLSHEEVREIRECSDIASVIAKRHKMCYATIRKIISRQLWKDEPVTQKEIIAVRLREINQKEACTRRKKKLRGTKNPQSKLEDSDIRMIRSSSLSSKALAQHYDVVPGTINKIRAGLRWRHVK